MGRDTIVMITLGKEVSFPIPEQSNLGKGGKGRAETFGSPNFFSAQEKEKRMPGRNQNLLIESLRNFFQTPATELFAATKPSFTQVTSLLFLPGRILFQPVTAKKEGVCHE